MGYWLNNGEMWAAYAAIVGTIVLGIQTLLIRQQKSGEDLMILESNYRYIVSYLKMHVSLIKKMTDPSGERNKYYKTYIPEHRIPSNIYDIVKTTADMAYKKKQQHNSNDIAITSDFQAYAIELANIINTAYVLIASCNESKKSMVIYQVSASVEKAFNSADERFTLFEKRIIHIKRRGYFNKICKVLLYTPIISALIMLVTHAIMFIISWATQVW